MKLILCPHCQDIVKLRRTATICECGLCWGVYLDDLQAIYSKDAIPLGIDNRSLAGAIKDRPESGNGQEFTAFVIPKVCPTFKLAKG